MNRPRTNALITGNSLILMAVLAGFAVGYALPIFTNNDQLDGLQTLISERIGFYKLMLTAFVFVVMLDLIVSWTLYQFFKEENKAVAFFSFLLRLIYTCIFSIAIYFLFANLQEHMDNRTLSNHYSWYNHLWSVGLIIFGGHLITIGVLMKFHTPIPSWLWMLTLFAGFSYTMVHFLKIAWPDASTIVDIMNNILALPMALGELLLAIWLLVKRGKSRGKQNS